MGKCNLGLGARKWNEGATLSLSQLASSAFQCRTARLCTYITPCMFNNSSSTLLKINIQTKTGVRSPSESRSVVDVSPSQMMLGFTLAFLPGTDFEV
jgi:hypothetical protein